MSKPYLGQTVLLLPTPTEPPGPETLPTSAIVTFVHDDCCVNLEVLSGDDHGKKVPGVVWDGSKSTGEVRYEFTEAA